ncbi:MAG TPA: adenylate/guanylate cyclase domain-containing protein [Pyrinomonadaceae bacterium]|nr:adenylate/guanylate cyclase domain-containing protein [Pyrinomonadaceae bacterium]
MPPISATRKTSFISSLLRHRYWALAILLTLAVWAGISLAMRPMKDADGSYASHPYGLTTGLENHALDLFFQLRDARHPVLRQRGLSEPITIIEIDEASIKASNVRLQKWPRDWYARLIDRASVGGAGVIGLDTFLSEEGGVSAEDKAADQKLAKSIHDAGNVVIAMKTAAGGFEEIKPLPVFAEAAYAVGFVDLPLDPDGFVRGSQLFQSRPGQDTKFSFSTRLAEGYLAAGAVEGAEPQYLKPDADGAVRLGDRVIRLRNDLNLQMDFRARSPAFRRVSAADILFNKQAQVSDDLFRNRIVLIGASNIDAPDLFPTPFYEPSALARLFDRSLPTVPKRTPGGELHANAAATLLFGRTFTRPRYIWQALAVLLSLTLVALSVFSLRALWGLLAVVLVAVLALVVSSWAFNAHGLILPLASAWLGMAILTPAGLGLRYARERLLRSETEAERAQMMDIFSRFVSSDVANEMWERRGQAALAGENRTVTIIFTDIRNFTTLSESESSDVVVEWLNDYFGRMNVIVESFGGHINKYIGDGLMIVFGAPVDRGDKEEARAAVDCGLAMLDEVERMNKDWEGTGRPVVKIGCGIHTGLATCGVVGAVRRLEYTVIGDTVNLSARLESTTKEFGVPILISEATAQLLGDAYEMKPLGEAKVKGKTKSTTVLTIARKKPKSESSASTAEAK